MPERRPAVAGPGAGGRARTSSSAGTPTASRAAGRLGGAFVHYGLGNFLFKENSAEGARTGVLEVTVTGRRVDGYRWIPGRISGSVPRPLAGADAATELSYWESLRGCAGLAP